VTSWLRIDQAARIILDGGIIAYPTEAVFGLGCLPRNDAALERIIRIKHRDARKGMILVAAEINQLESFAHFPDGEIGERMMADWPGPVTWVVAARSGVPPLLTGGRSTIAVRISDHPIVRQLCLRTGSALVSTSANFSGRRPAKSALQARRILGRELDYVLAGPLGNRAKPSEIRHFRTGEILRRG